MLTIGPQGKALTTRGTVALAVASNQQTVNGTDLPCPGPHSLDLGPQWKWEGQWKAEQGRSVGRTTSDDYSLALETHD